MYRNVTLLALVALVVVLLVAAPAGAQSECQTVGCHYPPNDGRTVTDWRTGECLSNCDPQLLYDWSSGAWYYLYSDGSWSWYYSGLHCY